MIIGLDCSSKSIHAVVLNQDGDLVYKEAWTTKARDMDAKLFELQEGFTSGLYRIIGDGTAIAVIENPIYIQSGKATIEISQVIGFVKAELNRFGLLVWGVQNTVWKKVVLGDGTSNKERIAMFAKARWGDVFEGSQDFADAACVALYGVEKGFNKKRK